MTLKALFKSTESPKERELMRKIDKIAVITNAKAHDLCRDPHEIDHISTPYPKTPRLENGQTKGIHVRELARDHFVTTLEVVFAPFGYSPSHFHNHYTVAFVKQGKINDPLRNLNFEEGDWYRLGIGEIHASQSIDGAVLVVYNTSIKSVADGIFIYHGYDPNQPPFDQLKMTES